MIYLSEGEQEVHITRPVAAFGSILLGELVAILSVTEHFTTSTHRPSFVRLFCDSQSAVGILTLNWSTDKYQDVIQKIKSNITELHTRGWEIDIKWTPGHSDITGNEVADRLAKAAAIEAKQLGEETSVVTIQDIKRHARITAQLKWQDRWDIGETGRELYICKPNIKTKTRLDFPDNTTFKQILQLRTGYCVLNEYRRKLGQVDTELCVCGCVESVEHYLCECPQYEDARLQLLTNLRNQLGLHNLQKYTLLGYDDHPEIANWREIILLELGKFITDSGRFNFKAITN